MSYNIVLENKSLDDLINIIYPVGSVYISVTSTNPKVLFGREWTQIKDTFLLACGNSYANGATGGEANHTLIVNEMPSHGHEAVSTSGSDRGLALYPFSMITQNYKLVDTNVIRPTGGNQPHNNMPPYLAVYMWKRIS